MEILEKLLGLCDQNCEEVEDDNDGEDDMESVEDFEDDNNQEQVIADSPLKQQMHTFFNTQIKTISWIQFVHDGCSAIPNYINLPDNAIQVIEEI